MLSIIQAAGWPIWPLLLCSIGALALIIERLASLRMSRVAPPRLLDEVISVTRATLPGAEVVNKLADNSILGTVLATGLRTLIAEPRITAEGMTVVVVEQDVATAQRVSQRIYCFQEGRVSLHGRSDRLTREQISAAYFGT